MASEPDFAAEAETALYESGACVHDYDRSDGRAGCRYCGHIPTMERPDGGYFSPHQRQQPHDQPQGTEDPDG